MSVYIGIKNKITAEIAAAAERARAQGLLAFEELPAFVLEKPREAHHGDLAANLAMLLTKQAKKSPRDVAAALISEMNTEGTWIETMEIAGPGFINFRLNKRWLSQVIPEILAFGGQYGAVNLGRGKKIQVEFVSANPTGLPHMGNARGAALGDSLASLLTLAGYRVSREFYINDAGNQIEKLADSLEARYLQALGIAAEFPEDGYQGQDLIDKVQKIVDRVGDRYLNSEVTERRSALTKTVLEENIADMRRTLRDFGVEFDRWYSEQSLYDTGKVQMTLQRLQEKGYIYEREGALWLQLTRLGDDKDEVVVRANGIPTYYAADIAYHADKFERGFTEVIDIWGADHHGHVARMKRSMQALGYDPDRLKVILMQLVLLLEDDKVKKMSKRLGQYVTLQELLDEVGKDAARFFFVMRDPDSTVEFDLNLAKQETSDNPVFYVQYAHARLCSILREALDQGLEVASSPTAAQMDLLTTPEEQSLLQKLAELPEEVRAAAQLMEPHRLAYYVLDVAALFHSFYHKHRVLVNGDETLRAGRLSLIQATRCVLANVLTLLGVSAPERM